MWGPFTTRPTLPSPPRTPTGSALPEAILKSPSKVATLSREAVDYTWMTSDQILLGVDPMQDLQLPDVPSSPRSSTKPRIFKEQRQRRREDVKTKDWRSRMEESVVVETEDALDSYSPLYLDRTSLCLPSFEEEAVVQAGDSRYQPILKQFFPVAESNATERLVLLKGRLKKASTYAFWQILMEEMCDIFSAQCGYVAKRILVDTHEGAVEMPALGEEGSCLMGTAFYLNSNNVVKQLHRDYKYVARGTPCAHMRHEKVFIIPERMSEVIPDNPNASALPWEQSEAYIGVPLFVDGKVFAHFGMIWSKEGAAKLDVSWNYVEMFMHSLEDLVQERIVEGRDFVKDTGNPNSSEIVPLAAITPAQSLKPYARNLSHELRTPMQGIVGMLDIMYSTVLDAIANYASSQVQSIFTDLKTHIEIMQESSKRAIDAADNVVHAYDMNLQMPEGPLTPEESTAATPGAVPYVHPQQMRCEAIRSPGKREYIAESLQEGPPLKRSLAIKDFASISIVPSGDDIVPVGVLATSQDIGHDDVDKSRLPSPALTSISGQAAQQLFSMQDFISDIVVDLLRRRNPLSLEQIRTESGGRFVAQILNSRNEAQARVISVEIESNVLRLTLADPLPLQFSLQKTIDNAVKFTEDGNITIKVQLSASQDKVEFRIADTGCGVAIEAQERLFEPHFQQNATINRPRDGMGLSLFNAKALVRRSLGGDLTLEYSAVDGPNQGSEFLIRIPVSRNPREEGIVVGHMQSLQIPSSPSYFASMSLSPSLQAKSPLLDRQFVQELAHMADTQPEPDLPLPPIRNRKQSVNNLDLAKQCPLNILIAEDNPINRKVAVASLAKLGYKKENITLAYDGIDAVARYQQSLEGPHTRRFDLVLMDIWMPNMDGYEATSVIKNLAKTAGTSTPVIAVTADITRECRDRAKSAEMEGFLTKPYRILDLEQLIVNQFSTMDVDV